MKKQDLFNKKVIIAGALQSPAVTGRSKATLLSGENSNISFWRT
jgi:hypothetical protein